MIPIEMITLVFSFNQNGKLHHMFADIELSWLPQNADMKYRFVGYLSYVLLVIIGNMKFLDSVSKHI